MKKIQLMVLLIVATVSIASMVSAAVCTTTVPAGGDIQAAITSANPGDVICLSPGLYTPGAMITVNKSVTIQGPQSGVDPRPSSGTSRISGDTSTEAIIDGGNTLSTILKIAADDVVIDGIEARNGTGDLLASDATAPVKYRTKVRYNIIHNSSGDEGMQLRNVTDGIIEYNYVYATAGDAINLCCGSLNGTIQFNEAVNISSPDGAIYVYDANNTTVQCNIVDTTYNNDGIKMGSKSGSDTSKTGGSILGNIVQNTKQDGISVYMSNTLVDSNEVYNSTSENGAIYVAWGVSNITISNNFVHNNTLNIAKWGNPGAIMIGTAVNAATVQVNNNNISGNSPSGVTNKAIALLNATNNYWGAADGPSGAGSGSGDSVSSNVSFNPWLTSPQLIISPCLPPDDQGPLTSDVVASPNPVAAGNTVVITATVDDSTTGNSNIASAEYSLNGIDWNSMDASDGGFNSPTETVTATNDPLSTGVYEVCVRGTDTAGNTGEAVCILLAVYDPTGGFVTGGGWINSPEEAYTSDPTLTGKATFGFVSKYQKGATIPTGQTEFQFKVAGLNFKSTSYEWLVVAGARAQYKGSGTINGLSDFGFMLTAIDGQISGGGGVDKFRIKIWDKNNNDSIVYDNQLGKSDTGNDATALGGGSIVIHKK